MAASLLSPAKSRHSRLCSLGSGYRGGGQR